MSLFFRSASGLRLHSQTSCPSATLASSLRRWIYNPKLSPPATMGPALHEQFRISSAPSLPPERFRQILNSGDNEGYVGLFKEPKIHLNGSSPEEAWINKSPRESVPQAPPDELAGRSVAVRGGDVGAAWGRLQGILRQDNIRRELRLTRRHEKKGAKRRRLISQRWRRRFAEEVRRKVKLVNEIRLRDRMWGAGRRKN